MMQQQKKLDPMHEAIKKALEPFGITKFILVGHDERGGFSYAVSGLTSQEKIFAAKLIEIETIQKMDTKFS